MAKTLSKWAPWLALLCLVVPMFASYYFDDMFSSISYLFQDAGGTQLGCWTSGASGSPAPCTWG